MTDTDFKKEQRAIPLMDSERSCTLTVLATGLLVEHGYISKEIAELVYAGYREQKEERTSAYPTRGMKEKPTLTRTREHKCPEEFYEAWMLMLEPTLESA